MISFIVTQAKCSENSDINMVFVKFVHIKTMPTNAIMPISVRQSSSLIITKRFPCSMLGKMSSPPQTQVIF